MGDEIAPVASAAGAVVVFLGTIGAAIRFWIRDRKQDRIEAEEREALRREREEERRSAKEERQEARREEDIRQVKRDEILTRLDQDRVEKGKILDTISRIVGLFEQREERQTILTREMREEIRLAVIRANDLKEGQGEILGLLRRYTAASSERSGVVLTELRNVANEVHMMRRGRGDAE